MHIVIDARNRRSSTGRYADRLLQHLQEIDTNNYYTVLVEPDDPWRPHNERFRVGICRYAQFSLNPLDQIGFAWQLYRLKPDLVHFTMTQQPLLYFGNIVTTTHDLTMLEYARAGRLPQWLHRIRMSAYRFLLWWSHRKSSRIIVPTEYVAHDVNTYHPFTKQKIVVTYEASEPPIDTPPKKPQHVSKPFIFYVGRAFPHKNLNLLIKAFENVNHRLPELSLVLSGKKEYYYEQLEEQANTSPARRNILFTGFVDDAELKWLYENTEAYVFPSLSEGFGLPGLEAMAHGCPVVSSNATCLPELYGDAAQYFDPKNVGEMADTIYAVVSDPTLQRKLVAAGREQVRRYSWQRMAQETLAVYYDCMSSPRAR
jgi:glycosyltransferase involved in cell wall biosynthesis